MFAFVLDSQLIDTIFKNIFWFLYPDP